MNPARYVRRAVIVHGPAGDDLERTLRHAGLIPAVETEASTIWLPDEDSAAGVSALLSTVSPSGPERLLLSVVEAAAVLGVGRSTVYQLIQRGELDVVHVGRCARIPATALRDLVDNLAQRGVSRPLGRIGNVGYADSSQPQAAKTA